MQMEIKLPQRSLLPRSLGDTTKRTPLAIRASLPPPASARNGLYFSSHTLCLQSTFTLQLGTFLPLENFISALSEGLQSHPAAIQQRSKKGYHQHIK